MIKDEAGGKQIVEFVGLRAKLDPYKMLDGSEDKKCKVCQRMIVVGGCRFRLFNENNIFVIKLK